MSVNEPMTTTDEKIYTKADAEALCAVAVAAAGAWRPISTAPKTRTVLVGYYNELGNWRTVKARYYPPGSLELDENAIDYDDPDDDGYAPEGWYEETETHDHVLRLEIEPTQWMPLPKPPKVQNDG